MKDADPIMNQRILVIDDNRNIHEDFSKILRGVDGDVGELDELEAALWDQEVRKKSATEYEVDSAYQGEEGLALVRRSLAEGRPYAMAFVDMRMPPGWDGLETISHIWEEYPDLQVVICTAYSDYSWEDMFHVLGGTDSLLILKKPFDSIEVKQLVYALCAKWSLAQQVKGMMDALEQKVQGRTAELFMTNEKLLIEMDERTRAEEEQDTLERKLQQAQKLEAVGLLAGGIAHEFNNMLTGIIGYSQLLLDSFRENSKEMDDLNQIITLSNRAAGIAKQLLAFSRRQHIMPVGLDLNEVIGGWMRMVGQILGEDVEKEFIAGRDLYTVKADRGQIEQALVNLAANARDAMPKGGKVTIETANVTFDDAYTRTHPGVRKGDYVMVTFADDGWGMDMVTQQRIFEPFFSTKEVGQGTGLGLSTTYGIIKKHKGDLQVHSEPDRGTVIKIYLPRDEEAVPDRHCGESRLTGATGSETILIVEDEPLIRSLLCKFLERDGYDTLEAADGHEALDLCRNNPGRIDLIITDIIMPKMNGKELAEKLRSRNPGLKVLYISGYNDHIVGGRDVTGGGTHFLQKPFTMVDVANKVRGILDSPSEDAMKVAGAVGES